MAERQNKLAVSARSTVAPAGSSFTNTASITSDTPDGDSSNNSGSVNVAVRPDGADLRLSKTKTPNPVAQGSDMVSTITVTIWAPNGPVRSCLSEGRGVTRIELSSTVCEAEERGVRRRTQRAKLTELP